MIRRRLVLAVATALACGAGALPSSASAGAPSSPPPPPPPAAPTKLLKGPYVTAFTDTTADLRFELDAPGPAAVELPSADGADAYAVADAHAADAHVADAHAADAHAVPAAPRRIADDTITANHLIHLTGLPPGKTIAYAVRLGAQVVGRGSFPTAAPPDAGAPVHFVVWGDNRTDPTTHEAVARAVAMTSASFLVNTGDIVEDGGSAADWQTFFSVEASVLREKPLLLCIGNHELYNDAAGANFARYFGFPDPASAAGAGGGSGAMKPYGTARVGPVRFFFLNGMHDWDGGEERAWLERELTRADAEPGLVWRMAVVHHSPWSSGPHGANARLVKAHVPELLSAHKVDLLFAGHDHIYERGDASGLKYVISGGGGAPLYRITQPGSTTRKAEAAYHYVEITATQDEVRSVAHRLDGTLLESCGFRHGQGWDCDVPMPAPAGPAAGAAPAPTSTPGSGGGSRCSTVTPGASASASEASGLLGARGGAGRAAGAGAALGVLMLGMARRARARRRRG